MHFCVEIALVLLIMLISATNAYVHVVLKWLIGPELVYRVHVEGMEWVVQFWRWPMPTFIND